MKEWTAPVATAAWAVTVESPGGEAPEAVASVAAGAAVKSSPGAVEGVAGKVVVGEAASPALQIGA